MAEAGYGDEEEQGDRGAVGREAAVQALSTIVQLHFEKTLEKKRAVATQKQELARLHHLFFIFLSLLLLALSGSHRLHCRHAWAPIALLSLASLAHYAAAAQTLRAINGLRYQRRCHKLTLALATDRLKRLRLRPASDSVDPAEFEVAYQEPPESYLGKFKRSWALHFTFLLATFALMVAASVVVLCY